MSVFWSSEFLRAERAAAEVNFFMDKRYSQLELFGEQRGSQPVGDEAEQRPFLFRVNLYQKTIFLLIGFLVTGVTFYCLGMEHGKARALARVNEGLDFAAKPEQGFNRSPEASVRVISPAPVQQQSIPAAASPSVTVTAKKLPVPSRQKQLTDAGLVAVTKTTALTGYTIQVGTYKVKTAAEREKVKLKKTGFSPQIVIQGEYSVVMVGNFTDKEKARSLLSKLRQNYRDCYIRRL